jgi:hypothetical protein
MEAAIRDCDFFSVGDADGDMAPCRHRARRGRDPLLDEREPKAIKDSKERDNLSLTGPQSEFRTLGTPGGVTGRRRWVESKVETRNSGAVRLLNRGAKPPTGRMPELERAHPDTL